MTQEITYLHQARGRVILTAIRPGRDAGGLEAITAMRWRDESGQMGQDSHVRLTLHVERGGELFVEQDGELILIEIENHDRFLHTRGVVGEATDPILQLPTY